MNKLILAQKVLIDLHRSLQYGYLLPRMGIHWKRHDEDPILRNEDYINDCRYAVCHESSMLAMKKVVGLGLVSAENTYLAISEHKSLKMMGRHGNMHIFGASNHSCLCIRVNGVWNCVEEQGIGTLEEFSEEATFEVHGFETIGHKIIGTCGPECIDKFFTNRNTLHEMLRYFRCKL